ncbi:MAG: zinc ribbon domain-containing protein [Chloroflexota bacterium]
MRRWLIFFVLAMLFVFPPLARAQGAVTLSNLNVQLWPEYDQPSMLVIVDFTVAADTQLPAELSFRIPLEANLIAVAALQNGALVDVPPEGPVQDGEWQAFTITVDTMTAYHFEYYEPLLFNGETRAFNYLWDGAYAVDNFTISVLEPLDASSVITDPTLSRIAADNGNITYEGSPVQMDAGEQYIQSVEYQKSSDALAIPTQELAPSAPVDENTPGRISLTTYLPYIFGGFGLVLILGGLLYYWQSGSRSAGGGPRRRKRARASEQEEGEAQYCHQCGTRAKPGDRFCRVCGSRLRQES